MSFAVKLNVYDLTALVDTNGMIKQMIKQMIPGFEGIWHTGIVVYGNEYFYGGGLLHGIPGQTPYGIPTTTVDLGNTEIPQDVFESFVEEMTAKYTLQNYDIFTNNCNHFTNDASQFLTGNEIPAYIRDLPQMFMQSPIGSMLMPMIRQFTSGAAVDPANAQANMADTLNQMGGIGNLFGGGNPFAGGNPFGAGGNPFAAGGNPFGGGGNPFAAGNNPMGAAPASTPAAPPPQQQKTGHEALAISTLPVRTKQATLYSSSSNIQKIFLKLKQLILESNPSFLDANINTILSKLEDCLKNRGTNPNFQIPSGTFQAMEKLVDMLPAKSVFPVFDLLRLLVLHPTAADYFSSTDNDFVDKLMTQFILCDPLPSEPAQWLGARIICNLCGSEKAGKNIVTPSRVDQLMELIITGFDAPVKQMRHTAATTAFNASLRCADNSDVIMQLLSAVCHTMTEKIKDLPDDVIFTLLMTLGRLVYKNQEGIDLVAVMDVPLDNFSNSSSSKIKSAAAELQLLLSTPAQ